MMVHAYFEDMRLILSELRRIAKKDAQLWLVVATSAYAGIEVPVDRIIADIGEGVGWALSEIGVLRELRSSGQHWNRTNRPNGRSCLRESVVIFRAE